MNAQPNGQSPTGQVPQRPAELERQMPQDQELVLVSKSSRRVETVVNVVAVIIAIVVILATVVAVWNWNRGTIVTCDPGCDRIDFTLQTTGNNWTMTVSSIHGYVNPSDVHMTILDANHVVKLPMSSIKLSMLTPANWATYKVAFQKVNSGSAIGVGDVVSVDKTYYPQGCRYGFLSTTSILAQGTLE